MKITDINEAIPALEYLIFYFAQARIDIGHAQRFFNVGEFGLAFEEIFYALKQSSAPLTGRPKEVFEACQEFFESD
jgi:hypothetical protein